MTSLSRCSGTGSSLSRIRFCAILICMILFCTIFSAALLAPARSQISHLPADQLARRSEIIAHGTVHAAKAEWDETRSMIRTRVTLGVDEYLKGGGGKTIELFVPGGEVDGVGELYTHMARFKQDEEVVVFVEKDARGRFRVTGGSDGKFAVKKEQGTGKLIVSGNKPLDELRAEVKRAVQVQQK